MKGYWPVMGVVGIVATVGLYAYVSRDPLYEESETKEFLEEEVTEYEAELPEDEIPVPYVQKAEEVNPIKKRQNHSEKTKKKITPQNQPYHPSFPQSSGLEDAIEEDEEERAWYDLPPEERNFKNLGEVAEYFNAALDARDYKVAESYIQNFLKFVEPKTPERYQEQKGIRGSIIVANYNEYLNDIIKNCKDYNYDSVFRKVMWMNFFAAEYEEIFPIYDPQTKKTLNLVALSQKGTEALDSLQYCYEIAP